VCNSALGGIDILNALLHTSQVCVCVYILQTRKALQAALNLS